MHCRLDTDASCQEIWYCTATSRHWAFLVLFERDRMQGGGWDELGPVKKLPNKDRAGGKTSGGEQTAGHHADAAKGGGQVVGDGIVCAPLSECIRVCNCRDLALGSARPIATVDIWKQKFGGFSCMESNLAAFGVFAITPLHGRCCMVPHGLW